MSSITITSLPKQLPKELPQEIFYQTLLGLDISLTTPADKPQKVICIGCEKPFDPVKYRDDSYAVSIGGLIMALIIAGQTQIAHWLEQKYPRQSRISNAPIVLIDKQYCQYNW